MNFTDLKNEIHRNAVAKGFWDKPREKSEAIANIHGEVSECWEAVRAKVMPQSDHIPEFTLEEEEIADIIIRSLDYAEGFGLRIEAAIRAKMDYNAGRPHMHGKKC